MARRRGELAWWPVPTPWPVATLLSGVIVVCALAGCDRSNEQQKAVSATDRPTTTTAAAALAPWRTDQFCVRALHVINATPRNRAVAGLRIDATLVRRAMVGIAGLTDDSEVHEKKAPENTAEKIPATQPCGDAHMAAQLGVALTFDYAGTSPTAGLVAVNADTKRLYVSAIAHVERVGPTSKAEVTRSTVEASGPIRKTDNSGLKRRITGRLEAAAGIAIRRALGQLWMRHRSDTEVEAALLSPNTWRRGAALQEVGERGLDGSVATVEAAAQGSLTTIAVVACATLGRLGAKRSVSVLLKLVREGRIEVADAALYAAHDIGGAAADAGIRAAAARHRSPWIRLRAKALLDAGTPNGGLRR